MARLLARIFDVFLLNCLGCGAEVRIIAFIIDCPTVRDNLEPGRPLRSQRWRQTSYC